MTDADAEVVDVSVVMAVYNAASTLRETVDSILAQHHPSFELVVVDDGSTDKSGAILDGYAASDRRVRVIHQNNRGLTRALMTGCAAARGRLIARHDSGDLSHPLRLQKQQRVLDDHPDVVFVSSWTAMVGPELEPLHENRGTGKAIQPIEILNLGAEHGVDDGPTSHPATMFRAQTYHGVGGYRSEFYYGQDWDLWYRLAASGKFQMIAEVLYTARIEPSSISSAARGPQQALSRLSLAAARARAARQPEDGILAQAAAIGPGQRPRLCANARGWYFIGEALRRRGDGRAQKYLRRALRCCPLFLPAWIRLIQSLLGGPREPSRV